MATVQSNAGSALSNRMSLVIQLGADVQVKPFAPNFSQYFPHVLLASHEQFEYLAPIPVNVGQSEQFQLAQVDFLVLLFLIQLEFCHQTYFLNQSDLKS